MKIKRLLAIIILVVTMLSGCSNEKIPPPESEEIISSIAETVIEETTTPQPEAEIITPTIEEKSDSKVEIPSPTYTEKETPSTEDLHMETVSQAPTTAVSDTESTTKIASETVPPSDIEPPKIEVQETASEEIPQATTPTVDIDFYISYTKEFAKYIDLEYDTTAIDCWDNPIAANENTDSVIADIESRLNRYKNIEGFECICIWYEKVSENRFEIYIGYA